MLVLHASLNPILAEGAWQESVINAINTGIKMFDFTALVQFAIIQLHHKQRIKSMKKVNSVFLEFEPITGSMWHSIRYELSLIIEEYGLDIITYETGIVNVPDSQQLDIEDI